MWKTFEKKFIKYHDRIAITMGENRINYYELYNLTMEVANLFIYKNYENRKIVIYCNDFFSTILGILAGICTGYVIVPVSPSYGEKNLRYILKKLNTFFVVTDNEELVRGIDLNNIIFIKEVCVSELEECKNKKLVKKDKQNSTKDGNQFIIFTSGSTDCAKGVVISKKNVLSNMSKYSEYLPLQPGDVTLIWRPICHAAVLFREVLYSLLNGCNLVLYNNRYIPHKILKYIKQYNCTYLGITPTLLNGLIRYLKNDELNSLKYITVSGERVRINDLKKIKSWYPTMKIFNVYGLTEATLQLTYLDDELLIQRENSVGKALKGYKIKIVNENGEECSQGVSGEVVAKSESIMKGYYRNDDATHKKIINGWLYTGDTGYMDKDGYLYILGRNDTMIIRAGVNIFPEEVEKIVLNHSNIVKDIVVYGCDDINYGQKVCADIVPKDENIKLEDLKSLCKKILPIHMQPDCVDIVERIERTDNGKILRSKISHNK